MGMRDIDTDSMCSETAAAGQRREHLKPAASPRRLFFPVWSERLLWAASSFSRVGHCTLMGNIQHHNIQLQDTVRVATGTWYNEESLEETPVVGSYSRPSATVLAAWIR